MWWRTARAAAHDAIRHAIAPARMVLLNPVLDFKTTFLEPRSPMAAEVFSAVNWSRALQIGRLEVGPTAALEPEFLGDLMLLDPELALWSPVPPMRIVHGTADLTVLHDLTRDLAALSSAIDFRSVGGAGHAFTEPTYEAAAFALMADWCSVDGPARTLAVTGDTRLIDPDRGRS